MADLNRFFAALSERMYKENNLSDITYALCEADVKFRQFFLDFFFHDAQLKASEVTIERETCFIEVGRPDFGIWTRDGRLYIVEVKIYDRSQHFEQYHSILKENRNDEAWKRLGYIANYEEVKAIRIGDENRTVGEVCSRVATWSEFVDGLDRYRGFEDPAIQGYVEYVRRVCPYDDFKTPEGWKISAEDFRVVAEFDKALENAIEQNDCKTYRRSTRSMYWLGRFFEWCLSGDGRETSCRGWIGAYYRANGAVVCVEFEETLCNSAIFSRFRTHVQNGVLRFYAPKADELVALADGKKNLQLFLETVLSTVKKGHVETGVGTGVQLTEPTVGLAEGLLPMKCLPRLLETSFLSSDLIKGLEERGCEIALSSCREAEVPQAHCGRYFAIAEKREKEGCVGNELCKAWVGVVYNPECVRTDGNGGTNANFGKSPAFIVSIPKDRAPDSEQEGWALLEKYEREYCVIADGPWENAFETARKRLLNLFS